MNNLKTVFLGGALILLVPSAGCAGGTVFPGNGGSGGSSAQSSSTSGTGGSIAQSSSSSGGAGGSSNGEICANGLDDNGDGQVDEGCACPIGATEPCFPGDPLKAGVGACKFGLQVCEPSAGEVSGSKWGACKGAGAPTTEVCNGVDDNCNGQVDEGCMCMPGTTITCYSGPNGTQDVGACHGGTKTCLPDGSGYSDCAGEVTPTTEVCGNGVDDDCDGQVDQGCVQCSTQTVVWDIPTGTTGGPNCITTGGGKCTEVLNCNGSTCSPQSCGAPHCGTLTCNDGTYTHLEYCSVLAGCSAGGVTATGFTW